MPKDEEDAPCGQLPVVAGLGDVRVPEKLEKGCVCWRVCESCFDVDDSAMPQGVLQRRKEMAKADATVPSEDLPERLFRESGSVAPGSEDGAGQEQASGAKRQIQRQAKEAQSWRCCKE